MAKAKQWGLKVTPKDDAIHPSNSPERWEWWYFDADFDNGYNMIGTFHFGSPRPPANPDARFIEIALYDPKGNKRMVRKRYPKEECSAAEDKLDVVIGPNTFKGDLKKTHLFFSADGQGCSINYESMVEPYLPEEPTGVSLWVVPHARAKVSGTLTWDGQTMDVKGEGYHDHNWYDKVMGATSAAYSLWTRIFVGDWTFNLYGGMDSRSIGGAPNGKMICYHKDKLVAVSKKAGGISSDYTTKEVSIEHPGTFRWYCNEPGLVDGEINFKTKNVLEFMDLHSRFKPFQKWYSEVFEGQPAYFRFRLDYDINLTILGEKVKDKGICWCEYHKFV
jgi:hypothetical protein